MLYYRIFYELFEFFLVYKVMWYLYELGLDGVDFSDSWEFVKVLNVI